MLVLLIVALGLRLMCLGSKSLWLDEAYGLNVAQRGQRALWAGQSVNYHPPLFYWLLEVWMRVGKSEFVLRLPGAILGSVSVFLIYVVAKDLTTQLVALAAAALVAFSPLLVWYSQELRPYALLSLVGLIVMAVVTKLLLRPAVSWWLVFVAGMIVALYLHYSAVLLLLLQIVLFTLLLATNRTSRSAVLFLLAGWLAAGIAYWPWLRTPVAKSFLNISVSDRNFFIRFWAQRLNIPLDLARSVQLYVIIGVLIAAVGLYLTYSLYRWAYTRHHLHSLRNQNWVHALLAFLFVVLLVASVVPRGYTIKRQLVLLWPYGLLLLAWFWPWQGRTRALLLGMLTLSLVAALVNVLLIPKPEWRQVTRFISENRQANDIVLLTPQYMTQPFDYYDGGSSNREGLPFATDPSRLEAVLDAYDRIWLVLHHSDADPQQRTRKWLDEHAALADTAEFFRLQVRLYEPQAGH